jgi:hypothetical protein
VFVVPDAAAEGILHIAKVVANSPSPMTKQDLIRSFEGKYGEAYVQNCLLACVQLALVVPSGGGHVSSDKYRDTTKRAHKDELNLVLRSALQEYPPFLLFADFVSKGYPTKESATMTRGILRCGGSAIITEKSLRLWGTAAGLIKKDEGGKLVIPEAEKGLPAQYVKNLVKALEDELKASIFLIETLSPQAYAYLTEKGISISELAKALVSYENDSEGSAEKACKITELFLYKFAEEVGVDVKKCNGVIELSDAIRNTKAITTNQNHLCHGLGGLRNMTAHKPDKDTGNPWTITPQGALVTILAAPAMVRSVLLFAREKKQEY